jgi:hypothetical protein
MAETYELPPWGEAALEEYKAHRAAFLDTEAAAQRTLAFGLTAIGILVAGAFNVWDSRETFPSTALFLVVIPIVSMLVLVQWSGQILFLVTRGHYLQNIEHAIRDVYEPPPELHRRPPSTLFTWEDKFDKRHGIGGTAWWKPDLRWHMHAGVLVFGLVAVGSLALGWYKGYESSPALTIAIVCVEAVLLISLGLWLTRKLAKEVHRRPASAEGQPRTT